MGILTSRFPANDLLIIDEDKLKTKNAAETCGFSGLGQLAPGYSADFIVLSEDIFTVSEDRIDQIQVEETYIKGERVYER